jgi:hypothetical protein
LPHDFAVGALIAQQWQIQLRRLTMKQVFSSIVAALVAVAFAGIVSAAEPAKKEAAPATPAAAGEVKQEGTKKPAKKANKAKKAKKAEKKDAAAPAALPAGHPPIGK